MKQRIVVAMLFAVSVLWCYAGSPSSTEKAIRKAVKTQIQTYPKSTLQDLYKSFFQDVFGPGHIISDSTAALNYLQHELAESENFGGVLYEPTGYRHQFYRVNLSVVKRGLVPQDVYLNAFIRSANAIKLMSMEEWKTEWAQIESVISSMNIELADYENDSARIATLLQNDKYAMHHSRIYGQTYQPHYRIIEKSIFENEILPLIKNAK